jgi:hypothetical protein
MKRNSTGIGHDGRSNAFSKRGEATLAVHHDPNEARKGDHGVKGNIARDGAPKRMHPVSVHNGMTERQQALAGMQHANAVAPDANPASPLTKEPQGKNLKPVAVTPGMRNRTNAAHSGMDLDTLGKCILAEAVCNK